MRKTKRYTTFFNILFFLVLVPSLSWQTIRFLFERTKWRANPGVCLRTLFEVRVGAASEVHVNTRMQRQRGCLALCRRQLVNSHIAADHTAPIRVHETVCKIELVPKHAGDQALVHMHRDVIDSRLRAHNPTQQPADKSTRFASTLLILIPSLSW